jgi:hypothetical protein
VADFADLGRHKLVFTSECVNVDAYEELLRQHMVPWVQRRYPGEKKKRSLEDLALVHTARTTRQLVAEFWTPADSLPYLPDLNLLNFSIWRVLKANVRPSLQNGTG